MKFTWRYPDLMRAGKFNIFPRRVPGGGDRWFWQKGNDPYQKWQGPFASQAEAEEAAITWYGHRA
jgi:hypothetical protein